MPQSPFCRPTRRPVVAKPGRRMPAAVTLAADVARLLQRGIYAMALSMVAFSPGVAGSAAEVHIAEIAVVPPLSMSTFLMPAVAAVVWCVALVFEYGVSLQRQSDETLRERERIMAIILRLDRVMADRKMSLNELAGRVGVSNVNLSKIKTGKISAVRFSTLNAICDVLDCQPGDLLEFVREPAGAPE